MIALGLDPSKRTGWAVYDTRADVNTIQFGTLDIRDRREGGEFELMAGDIAVELKNLIPKIGLPDFALVEKAPRQSYGGGEEEVMVMGVGTGQFERKGSGLQSTLCTNQIAAGLCATLACFKIPYATVMPSTWRKRAYGFGTKDGWERKHWKRYARERCAMVRLSVKNDDEAEAVWIAWGARHEQIVKNMENDKQKALL